jgi:hypothetical protein
MARLQSALNELQAVTIAVPPFDLRYLEMGLAIHFRCRVREAENMRIDIISKMRGVNEFEALWRRRTTFSLTGYSIEALSLPDLVLTKKTQRDKDWPMLTRLVEQNYFLNRDAPSEEQIDFWFREMRTPSLLVELSRRLPKELKRHVADRAVLSAVGGPVELLKEELRKEEAREREADRRYWEPLRDELHRLRHARRGS